MPITKSAKKALRQSVKRRQRNIAKKSALKALLKQSKKLAEQKNLEEAKALLPQIYKALDKAAKRGIIKKNSAARKKSRLTRLFSGGAGSTTKRQTG